MSLYGETGYYSSTIKRKELKLWAKTWINIENKLLNEVNQSKKAHYVVPHI